MSIATDSDADTAEADATGAADVSTDDTAKAPADTRPWTERLRAELPFIGPIVGLVLGIKLLVFSFGVVVAETVGDRTFTHFSDRFAFWNVWDAPHYLALAEHGYVKTGDPANFIVFLPGYPGAVALLNQVFPGGVLTSAFFVTGIASIAAALLLGYLVRHDTGGDKGQATTAVWFLLIFPTAYFLHIPYTESLFLTFVFGSFLAARTGHWATAGIIGALAALTRLNGILLLPALAIEAYFQYRKTGRFDRSWLWIGFIATGLLVYLGINQSVFGDPFHFQSVQSAHWYKHFQNPFTTIKGMLEGMGNYKPADRQMLVVQELLFLTIGLAAAIAAWFWTRPSYAVWSLLNVLLFASTSFIQSTPRYVITIFPIFILLAKIDRRSWISMLASTWSLAMMAWFMALFALGKWAF